MLSKLHLNCCHYDKWQDSMRSQTSGIWGNFLINGMVLVYILNYFIKENNAVGLSWCVFFFPLRAESYFIHFFHQKRKAFNKSVGEVINIL